jgi:glycosyltransferase involved in cell wall biosynthesis
MKKISIIIPFYNEKENLPRIYDELSKAVHLVTDYQFEILLMDNHSNDGSEGVALSLCQNDNRLKYFRQSRNFGYQINILSGYLQCSGHAAIQLDADGEDDPLLIKEFISSWEKGYKVVYGVRKKRVENIFVSFQRKVFYRLLRSLSEVDIPVDAGDFRLVDRQVIEALRGFKESTPYIRGLLSYAGFSQLGIPYERRSRYSGESKFSWWDYCVMAWGAITSFSKAPLVLIGWIGFFLCATSFILGLGYLAMFLLDRIVVQGFTTLILIFLFFSGVNLLCLGILATYVGRVFDEVKARPRQFWEKL